MSILNGTVDIINNLANETQRNNTSFGINDIISKNHIFFTIFIAIILIVIIGLLYARKKRKKTIPPEFELGTENNNMKRKEISLSLILQQDCLMMRRKIQNNDSY